MDEYFNQDTLCDQTTYQNAVKVSDAWLTNQFVLQIHLEAF